MRPRCTNCYWPWTAESLDIWPILQQQTTPQKAIGGWIALVACTHLLSHHFRTNRLARFYVQHFLISAMWKKLFFIRKRSCRNKSDQCWCKFILPFVLSTLSRLVICRYENSKGQCVVWVKEQFSSFYCCLQRKYIFVVVIVLVLVILELNKVTLWF